MLLTRDLYGVSLWDMPGSQRATFTFSPPFATVSGALAGAALGKGSQKATVGC
jgi:hypothetical protein